MARTSTRVKDTGIAIQELFRLVSMPGRSDAKILDAARRRSEDSGRIPETERVRYLLDFTSIQRLFKAVPPSAMVHKQLAAAYLDCSVVTLERRLRAYLGNDLEWRRALKGRYPPDYDGLGRYRWSFILAQPRPAKLGPERKRKPSASELHEIYDALTRKVRFLCQRDGGVVGAWGQAHLSAKELIAYINRGAIFELLTPVEALARPWVSRVARAPWAEALEQWWVQMRTIIAHGQARTDALELEASMGPAQPRVGRRRTPRV